ncbi:hypothetical protein J4558_10765 [Leptolyngbya sp. 15MV]|nr:hypothetical protein J4558_10765 [Leptolyngbya sp. 15MV]
MTARAMSLSVSQAVPMMRARIMRWRDPVLLGFAAGFTGSGLWGLYLALSRAGVVGGLAALDIAVLRYGIAGLMLDGAGFLQRWCLNGWWRLVVVGGGAIVGVAGPGVGFPSGGGTG